MRIGLDIGSTTAKVAVLDTECNLLYSDYRRHYSQVADAITALIQEVRDRFPDERGASFAMSGSAGMGLAEKCGIPFVQEVYATRLCAEKMVPDADVIIELGGEDAKIIFLKGIPDARMNGSCAGGTGAFLDQMATLLGVTTEGLNQLAKNYEKVYTIASRCGVFAKSDVQPLINQGARDSDIAESILQAVVNQTISGLAQGRPIRGKVLYLGGPLTFLDELRYAFDRTLKLCGVCPEHSLYYVAMGAAENADVDFTFEGILHELAVHQKDINFAHMPPLFQNEAEYRAFCARHARTKVKRGAMPPADGRVYLGVDAGSTTVKFAVIGTDGALLDERYESNSGNPVPRVRAYLEDLYTRYPDIRICGSASTGYGEDLIRNAFSLDFGVVETVAHLIAAKELEPDVDFILDIGGQDMKCLKIHNGVIDNIYLNEACSSGCGSFLQTFASALGMDIAEFAKLGIYADSPVDLGSRCTVFMNSSVKQAQKDGASLQNISAGLSVSIIKNALYKVIRVSSAESLGKHVVVQGGTFYNDCVLRTLERELGTDVVRPDISGLMGAYGAALYARDHAAEVSSTLGPEQLAAFTHESRPVTCSGCENHCRLTINTFSGGRRYISGNRCERPVTSRKSDDGLNLCAYKRHSLESYAPQPGKRGKVGIPLGLNMYEQLPFWHTFFTKLGFEVVTSPVSSRALYVEGQDTIPSDTVCFPAKLMHGHVRALVREGCETIFYPCMSYNLDEGMGDNCFNCPIVAYYPEVLAANVPELRDVRFIHGYVGLHRPRNVPRKLWEMLYRDFYIPLPQIRAAVHAAYAAYQEHMAKIAAEGERVIAAAREEGKPIIVLAGRPYHIDPEINHGMDRLITGMGMAVVSEDALRGLTGAPPRVQVLNQWTYHSRLYAAAEYVAGQKDMQFVQLVSFGCGCDAITTDECRRILEESGKIYTQIKIDEIENLGAAKIRLRSLFAAAGIEK